MPLVCCRKGVTPNQLRLMYSYYFFTAKRGTQKSLISFFNRKVGDKHELFCTLTLLTVYSFASYIYYADVNNVIIELGSGGIEKSHSCK